RAVGVAAPLLHVRQMGLVGLGVWARRRILLVLARGQPAAWAVPHGGREGLGREVVLGVVPVGAPVTDQTTWNRLDSVSGGVDPAHRAGSDSGATNGVATCHGLSLLVSGGKTRAKLCGVACLATR